MYFYLCRRAQGASSCPRTGKLNYRFLARDWIVQDLNKPKSECFNRCGKRYRAPLLLCACQLIRTPSATIFATWARTARLLYNKIALVGLFCTICRRHRRYKRCRLDFLHRIKNPRPNHPLKY